MWRFCNQTLIKCFHVLFLTSFWPHLGTLWSSLGSFWGILGALWPALGASWAHFGLIWGLFLTFLGLVPQRVAKELPRPSQRPKLTQNGASRPQNRAKMSFSGGLFNRKSSTDLLLVQVRKCFQNGSSSGQDWCPRARRIKKENGSLL